MGRYLKKHKLLKIQVNVTVQWLKQKLKFLQKGKKKRTGKINKTLLRE